MPKDNGVILAEYKGEVIPCKFCKAEETLLGRACHHCLSNGYLAICLACDGSGMQTENACWDGGKSKYKHTCNICGGARYFPARSSEYIPKYDAPTTPMMDIPAATTMIVPGLIIRRTSAHE